MSKGSATGKWRGDPLAQEGLPIAVSSTRLSCDNHVRFVADRG